MDLIKHEYELSIWKDVWAQPTLLDDYGNVVTTLTSVDDKPILDEEKSGVLSTDTMTFPGKATNIIFKTKLNGTHELTFDLPGKYVDTTTGKKVKNYLRDLIDNETKVKLYYKEKWYSFYVKKVTEKREKNYMVYSYSCEDSFITELSKNGYKITFNEYTEHYIEQIHTFAQDILEGSEWDYSIEKTEALCDLTEYQEEKLVKYVTNTTLTGMRPLIGTLNHTIYSTDQSATPITIPSGTVVYGFYSEYKKSIVNPRDNTEVKQFIYIPEDEEVLISGNTIVNKRVNYICNAEYLTEPDPANIFHEDYRYGNKIVYSPYTEYIKELDRFAKKYYKNPSLPNDVFYSYTKTRIMVPEIATNYAANGKDMVDTTGWAPEVATDKLAVDKLSSGLFETDSSGYPTLVYDDNGKFSPNTYGIVASQLTTKATGGRTVRIINSGPYSRKLTIDTPTSFAIKLQYKWTDPNDHTTDRLGNPSQYLGGAVSGNAPNVCIYQPVVSGIKDSYYSEIVTESSALDDDGNYVFAATPLVKVNSIVNNQYAIVNFTNDMLADGPLTDLFIVIEIDAQTNQTLDFCIQSLEFFEAFDYNGGHTVPAADGYLRSQECIAPSWASYANPVTQDQYYQWMHGYIRYLHTGEVPPGGEIPTASQAYTEMQSSLQTWEDKIINNYGEDGFKYTLVTSDSIVSGKSFDEEIYFKLDSDNRSFSGKRTVVYINPKEGSEYYNMLQWYDNFKYRTLKQEKSNRFNLTQELSKLFQVYPCYDIDYYANGKVKKKLYDENNNEITIDNYTSQAVQYSKRVKTLYYSDRTENENKYGFKYGHNLNSISRVIDSANVISKMFVTDNLSQYAKDGICTIARAADNIGKDTYIFNFDYFVDRQLVKKDQITQDLYSADTVKDSQGNPYVYTWENYKDGREDEVPNSEAYTFDDVNVYKGFLRTIGEINSRYDYLTEEKTTLEKHQLVILEASVQTYTSAVKSLREQLAKQKNLLEAYQKEQVNKKQAEYAASCERIESKIATYEIYLEGAQSLYETYADLYNRYNCEQKFLLDAKKQEEDKFNSRYESLIKEGVWQDSKYLNDEAYYLDAEKVSNDSKGPKITYTINVTDLSVLQKYKFTDFNVGDVTYVEDYEFFGDDPDGTAKFYNEKTIVAAITCNLDNPSKNSISLQNYTTKFDDLFSRITASVQSLTFNENIYQRAANFTTTGALNGDSMQDSLSNNDLTLVGNQDVQIDGNGILVTDLRIPSNKVKVVGSGVFLTADGGNSWYGAFENGGINASLLTVGAINTKSISIFNENYSNFVWDKDGLTAYATASAFEDGSSSVTNKSISHSYVRFNHYGLYFVKDSDQFDQDLLTKTSGSGGKITADALNFIMNNADVAVTYNGFAINGLSGKVRFTSADGIVMKDDSDEEVIRLGHITNTELDDDIKDFWGLYARGAYIEGKIYTNKVVQRTVDLGVTGKVKVDDISRSMLNGGRLEISKTVVESGSVDVSNRELKKITSFGAALYNLGKTDDDLSVNDQLNNLGSTVYVHKDGCFWSVSSYNDTANTYNAKLLYSRKALGTYPEDAFVIKCDWFINEAEIPVDVVAPQTQSDIKIKKNIATVSDNYLDFIDKLQVKTYNLKTQDDSAPKHIGLIAQEVQQALTDCGLTDNGLVSQMPDDTLTINYTELLTLAIAKIQQLEKRITELENKKPGV